MSGLEELRKSTDADSIAVFKYIEANVNMDYSKAAEFFSSSILYNDLMYPVSGLKKTQESLQEYVTQYLDSFRVEAICKKDKYFLMISCIRMKENTEKDIVVSEVISVKDGLINCVENCFNKGRFNFGHDHAH